MNITEFIINPKDNMQRVNQCSKCAFDFDQEEHLPKLLECQHILCATCALFEYEANKQIKCCQCEKITKKNSNFLKNAVITQKQVATPIQKFCQTHKQQFLFYCHDEEKILCKKCLEVQNHQNHKINSLQEVEQEFAQQIPGLLEELKNKQNQIEENCEKAENVKQAVEENVKDLQQFLEKEVEYIIKQIIKSMNFYWEEYKMEMKEELQGQIQRKEELNQIKDLIQYQNTQPPQSQFEVIELFQKISRLQKWTVQGVKEQIIENVKQINFQDYIKTNITFQVDTKKIYQELQRQQDDSKFLLFAEQETSNIIKYNIINQTQEKFEVNTPQFGVYYRAIQIDEDTIIVTGGKEKLSTSNRISIIKNKQVQQYQMITERYSHNLTFYQKTDLLFFISGCSKYFTIKQCETFNLKTKQSNKINDIPEGQRNGGAAIIKDNLYNFGGFNGQKLITSIYEYIIKQDQWRKLQVQLPQASYILSVAVGEQIYLFDDNSELDKVYAFQNIDLKEVAQKYNKGSHVRNQPKLVGNKIYFYTVDDSLLTFDIKTLNWEKKH